MNRHQLRYVKRQDHERITHEWFERAKSYISLRWEHWLEGWAFGFLTGVTFTVIVIGIVLVCAVPVR